MGYRLAISNIAWAAENDAAAYDLMHRFGFVGLEIAPTRVFPEAPYDQIDAARSWSQKLNAEQGFVVPSMQSIWYGRKENIFVSAADRQALLDYILAITLLGLAGLAKKLPESWGLYPSIIAAALARILFHTMSGVQFYELGTLASFEYNITYLGPDTLICIVLAFIIAKPVMRMMRRH